MRDRIELLATALLAFPALLNRQVLTEIRQVQEIEGGSPSEALVESIGVNLRYAEAVKQGWKIEILPPIESTALTTTPLDH